MATVGRLNAILSLNSTAFSRGLKGAKARTAAFAKDLGAATLKIAKMGAAATAAGVAIGTMLVKSSLKSMDATSKLSDRLGISTEKLIGLQHAANITGAGSEMLSTSLEKMAKGLGEATMGTGTAKQGLDMLGLNLADMLALDPAAQFAMIAEATSKLGTQSEKAAAASFLFGRSGIKLVNTLALGSSGLAQMQAEAEKLGLTFDRETGAKAEIANDALARLKAIVVGLGNTLAGQLAPYIADVSTRIMEFATSGEGMAPKVLRAFEWVTRGVAKLSDWFSALKAVWYTVKAALILGSAAIIASIDLIGGAIVKLLNLLPGVNIEWTNTFGAMADDLVEQAKEASKAGQEAGAAFWSGENEQRVKAYFASVRAESDKTADAIAQKAKQTGTAGILTPAAPKAATPAAASASGKESLPGFEQIVRGRTSFGAGVAAGGKGMQMSSDPRELAYLYQIVQQLKTGLPARAA